MCEWQGVERPSQEDRDTAGEEGIREVSAGLLAAGHDQAELRARHVLQQLRPRLCALRVLLEVCIRACHLATACWTSVPPVWLSGNYELDLHAACLLCQHAISALSACLLVNNTP